MPVIHYLEFRGQDDHVKNLNIEKLVPCFVSILVAKKINLNIIIE